MGLTRLSGGILFGSMAFLGVASIAGLIVAIVTYTQGQCDGSLVRNRFFRL